MFGLNKKVPVAGWGRRSALPRLFVRAREGTAAVEFALLALPFFLIVFAILETAFIFIGNVTLEQAVTKASRIVRTGNVARENVSEADFRKMLCGEITVLMSCDNIKLDLRSYSDFASIPTSAPIVAGALSEGDFRFERGNAGQIMALRAFYEWPLFTNFMESYLSDLSGRKHLLMSVSVFQTEPF